MAKKTAKKKKTQTKTEQASSVAQIESSIIELRGERLILDSDLAALYDVETKRLTRIIHEDRGAGL